MLNVEMTQSLLGLAAIFILLFCQFGIISCE